MSEARRRIKFEATAAAVILAIAGTVTIIKLQHDQEQNDRTRALTMQGRSLIAGFVSVDPSSISDIDDNLGTGPLKINYVANGVPRVCTATFGFEGFLTNNQKTASDVGIKNIGNCPPKQ